MGRLRVARAAVAGLLLLGVAAACTGAPDAPSAARATETVWCADADGNVDTLTSQGHDGPLTAIDVRTIAFEEGEVSDEELVDACARRFRWLTDHTLCEAYADPDALRRHAATDPVTEQHGEIGDDPPGFPVVVRDRVRCEDLELRSGPTAALAAANGLPVPDRLRAWEATASFNDRRAHEALWREAADAGCLDLAAATEHAVTAQADLDGDWPVLVTARDPDDPSHAGLCFDVRFQRAGFIEVDYHAVASPGGRSRPEP